MYVIEGSSWISPVTWYFSSEKGKVTFFKKLEKAEEKLSELKRLASKEKSFINSTGEIKKIDKNCRLDLNMTYEIVKFDIIWED